MTPWFLKPKILFLSLMIFAGLVLFIDLGKGSFWDWDEAIYASVAKEVVVGGDWLTLHLNNSYWPEKPPLMIWCMSGAYKVFGINEFSARLPSAIFGFLSVGLIYFIGKRFFNQWVGLVSGFFLATNLHFLILSRMAMLDIPMAFFITASLICFWLGLEKPRYFVLAGIAAGLAVLAKGPVGFLPFLVIFFYILLTSRYSVLKQSGFWVMGVLALLISAPWHIYQVVHHGKEFTDYYFKYNLFLRATMVLEGHSGSVAYYIKYVSEHFFTPWLCLSVLVIVVFGFKYLQAFKSEKLGPVYFVFCWFLVPFVFFTLAKTKVVGYVVPCYFPLALITGQLSLEHLRYAWFKFIFYAFLLITLVYGILFFPMHMILVDKSPEVKEALTVPWLKSYPLLVYNIPPNAPIFYFKPPVIWAGDLRQMDNFVSQHQNEYVLMHKSAMEQIQAHLKEKNKFQIVSSSHNHEFYLVLISRLSN